MTEEKKTYEGKIVKLSPKGWGFITSKELPFRRIYFHWTNLSQKTVFFEELKKHDEVDFEVKDNGPDKGLQAINIHALEPDTTSEDECATKIRQRSRKTPEEKVS